MAGVSLLLPCCCGEISGASNGTERRMKVRDKVDKTCVKDQSPPLCCSHTHEQQRHGQKQNQETLAARGPI